MATEIVFCHPVHVIDGVEPWLDDQKFEVQHPNLIGKPCDCGRLTYSENKCNTCSGDRWRIVWLENTNR